VISFEVPVDRYPPDEGRILYRRALEDIGLMPGVTAVGLTSNMHLNVLNTSWEDVNIDGHTPPPGHQAFQIDSNVSDAGWFGAAGVRLLRGRLFDDAVDLAGAPRVVIVNQAFVERFWPGEDGLGQMIRMGSNQARIVGVVATARIRTLGESPRPFLYRPLSQNYSSYMTLVARTTGNAERLVPDVFTRLRSLERQLVFIETKTMERHMSAMLLPARLGALVIGAAATLALLLAVIGLYGVVSYAVASRTREVGIRMSLGANRTSVVKLMMSSALRLVGAGALVGLILAAVGGSLLRSLLFGVQTLDPVTFVGVPLLLLVVAAVAAWLPARRASRVDPITALKVN
jgi:predicted permease